MNYYGRIFRMILLFLVLNLSIKVLHRLYSIKLIENKDSNIGYKALQRAILVPIQFQNMIPFNSSQKPALSTPFIELIINSYFSHERCLSYSTNQYRELLIKTNQTIYHRKKPKCRQQSDQKTNI